MKFLNLTASNFVWNPKDCTRNFVAFVKNKTLKERVESAQNHNNSVQWDLKLFLLLIILLKSLTKTELRVKNALSERSFSFFFFLLFG